MSDDSPLVIECSGDPRAMGEAQGRALALAIRDRATRAGVGRGGRGAGSLRALASGPVLGRGPGLEVVRHYPHLCERIQGLARGARLPIDALMLLQLGLPRTRLPLDPSAEAEAVFARGARGPGGGASVERRVAIGDTPGGRPLLRRSVPEVGFRSLEITLPWLASAMAGVNEAGVVAAFAPRAPHVARAEVGAGPPSAPALLLVQECLQRFESLGACLDWVCNRPASGNGALVLADAAGVRAAVDIVGRERRVVETTSDDVVLVAGGSEAKGAELREDREPEASDAGGAGDARAAWLVRVEPRERRLTLRGGSYGEPRAFDVSG